MRFSQVLSYKQFKALPPAGVDVFIPAAALGEDCTLEALLVPGRVRRVEGENWGAASAPQARCAAGPAPAAEALGLFGDPPRRVG